MKNQNEAMARNANVMDEMMRRRRPRQQKIRRKAGADNFLGKQRRDVHRVREQFSIAQQDVHQNVVQTHGNEHTEKRAEE